MNYPGGKNGGGAYQRIINLIPPHDVYIEPFAGSAAVFWHKARAASTILIDADARSPIAAFEAVAGVTIEIGDGIQYLREYPFTGSEVVYCDPPYLMETRTSGRIYRHEFSDLQHRQLLRLIKELPCRVLISGYGSSLYSRELKGWRVHSYMGQTRGGPRKEYIWFNYPEPDVLHDYSHLGDTFRQRERIRRKISRALSKYSAMPDLERNAILAAGNATFGDGRGASGSPDMALPDSSIANFDYAIPSRFSAIAAGAHRFFRR